MSQMKLAKQLDISQGWLWKIYNGYAKPGKHSVDKLSKMTGKPAKWWESATVSQVQKVLDSIKEAK